jgi:hypothetical protein
VSDNELLEWAKQAKALLAKAPKVTRDMYTGKDRVSWGKRAQELVKSCPISAENGNAN